MTTIRIPVDRKATAMTTTTAVELVAVTVPTREHPDACIIPITVVGEPIAPGLLITPTITEGRYHGGWTVTHQPSGMAIRNIGPCIACLRRAANHLIAAPVDWTRPMADIAADPAVLEAVKQYNADAWCDRATCR